MVRYDREPWIDVYDAAAWSAIYECSRRSLDETNGTVEIPDYTRGRWKSTDWRCRPAAGITHKPPGGWQRNKRDEYPLGESNPCLRTENPMSWATRRRGPCQEAVF